MDLADSHVIPALIRKCLEAQAAGQDQMVVWGDGSPMREFLYVEECARAILLAAERYDKPDPVNLGTGQEISINCVATDRARREFGFQATVTLEEGLRRTIAWYRDALLKGADAARA